MNSIQKRHKWVVVCLSAFVLLTLFLLAAATYDSQVGRYRMSVITRNNFTDIYVIDTATGIVKYLGADEGKPFDQIKGR